MMTRLGSDVAVKVKETVDDSFANRMYEVFTG
jgi:hypothetical protein